MMFSRLKPDTATMTGLLTAAGVFLIYNNSLPSIADVHVAPPHDDTVESARKHAAYESAALIALVFLVARDLNSYIISGAALVGIDYMYKHHNGINPNTGKLDVPSNSATPADATVYPLPEYSEQAQ